MTLYEQFIETIQATQDKNLIVDNILRGLTYITLKIEPIEDAIHIDNNLLKISFVKKSRSIPCFEPNEIYLPYNGYIYMTSILSFYTELSICHINKKTNIYIEIDITKTLNNFQKNNIPFNSHQVELPKIKDEKQLNFIKNYQSISKYLKEKATVHKNKNYSYILIFNYSFFNDPILGLSIVNPKNFQGYDLLFFSEKEELIKENSNLIFKDSKKFMLIDTERTIEKIELFNSMKNF